MHSDSIAIFPASGGIGGSTYRHLLDIVDAKNVILVARSPTKIPETYTKAGAISRYGDYDKLESLDHAFDGARYLNLISYASIEHEYRTKVQKYAIDAAIRSGVEHIFYSSLGFAGNTPDSLAFVMQAHLDTERYLAQLAAERPSFTYTIVRQGLYTESYGLYLAFLDLKNPPKELKIPHDGEGPGISWVKREELGEGTAHLLADYIRSPATFSHINKTLLLSGPQELSIAESVKSISRVLGKDVKIQQCSIDEWASQNSVDGASKYLAGDMKKHWATVYDALRRGEGAVVTDHLRRLLDREPEKFETTIKNMAIA
ncbi:unnamed protein product [Alternaria alternata]